MATDIQQRDAWRERSEYLTAVGGMLHRNVGAGYRLLWKGALREGDWFVRFWLRVLLLSVHANVIIALALGLWIGGAL